MKGPCPHCISATGGVCGPSMCHVRWYVSLQHCYGRGNVTVDNEFDKLLHGHWEGTNVAEFLHNLLSDSSGTYPVVPQGTNSEVVNRMLTVNDVVKAGGVVVVGESVASIASLPDNDGYGFETCNDFDLESPQKLVDGLGVASVHSPYACNLLTRDAQAEAVMALGSAATNDYCSSKNIFEDAWKTCEHPTPLHKLFGQKLKEARDAVVQTAVDSFAGSLLGARLGTYDFGYEH